MRSWIAGPPDPCANGSTLGAWFHDHDSVVSNAIFLQHRDCGLTGHDDERRRGERSTLARFEPRDQGTVDANLGCQGTVHERDHS